MCIAGMPASPGTDAPSTALPWVPWQLAQVAARLFALQAARILRLGRAHAKARTASAPTALQFGFHRILPTLKDEGPIQCSGRRSSGGIGESSKRQLRRSASAAVVVQPRAPAASTRRVEPGAHQQRPQHPGQRLQMAQRAHHRVGIGRMARGTPIGREAALDGIGEPPLPGQTDAHIVARLGHQTREIGGEARDRLRVVGTQLRRVVLARRR